MQRWAGICRFGGVGDNLIAASVLRPLKKLGYQVEVITATSDPHTVYFNNPFIDKLSLKADGDIPGGAEWQKWFIGRRKEFDLLVNLSHSCEHRHALFKDSTAFWWPDDYRRKMCAGSYLETVHDIVGVPHIFGPLFFPTDEEKDRNRRATKDIGPYLAWVCSGSRIDKIYPYAAMAIARIIKELDIPVIIFGIGDKQHEMAVQMRDHIVRQNGDRKKLHLAVQDNVAAEARWPLRASLTSAVCADLVVTPDTGTAWAVAMESMPKVVMVSHTSVENITKHWVNTVTLHADPNNVPCWPCHRLHDTIETCTPNRDGGHAAACMSDITVEKVLETVAALWKKRLGTLKAVA